MAISNTYGRVQKPLGFDLIVEFSSLKGFGGEDSPDVQTNCALWMPLAPQGYKAVGCVAHTGNQPPPNNTVYCLRSDLVTSTMYSDCIFSTSEFSIWRLDNVLGSFCAHKLTSCPPKGNSFDVSHLLLWNPNQPCSSSEESGFESGITHGNREPETSNKNENSSGWDVVRSVSKSANHFTSTPNFERVWWDKGCDHRRPVSIWRPQARSGYAVLGDCIVEGLDLFLHCCVKVSAWYDVIKM